MKKSILSTTLFASLLILFFTACTKEMPSSELGTPGKYTPDVITTDESLAAFNDAMIRFDPLYLQVVFKETTTTDQIQSNSKELLMELNKNPLNAAAQAAITKLYHFQSFEALKKTTDLLSKNALTLKIQYFQNKDEPTSEQKKIFSESRKQFLKTS